MGRLVCVDASKSGDITKTGLIWDSKEVRRTMSTVSIDPENGLLFVADLSGYIYCFDAETGQKYWKHDMQAHIWGSTLVADGKVYCGDEDGDLQVFASDKRLMLICEANLGAPIYSAPIVANGVLYLATASHLWAIAGGATDAVAPEVNLFGDEIVTKAGLEDARVPGGVVTEQGARTAPAGWPAGFPHALIFQDRRRLRGELVAVTKQEVRWRLPGAEGILRFGTREISRVDLHPDMDSDLHAGSGSLSGQLETVAENKLISSDTAKPLEDGLLAKLQNVLNSDVPHSDDSPEATLILPGLGALGVTELEVADGRMRSRSTLKTPIEVPLSAAQMIEFRQARLDASPEEDMLVFQNGEELAGRLLSAGVGEAVRWRTNRGSDATIDSSRIAGIRLFSAQPAPKPDGAVLEFRNGDRLRGSLDGFDERLIRFKGSLFGPESVSVKDLRRLSQDSGTGPIDRSVRSSDWLVPGSPATKASWSVLDGSFFHQAGAPYIQMRPESLTWRAPMEAFPAMFELSFSVSQANAKPPHFVVEVSGANRQFAEGIRITENGTELEILRYGGDRSKPAFPHSMLLTKKLANLTSRVSCRVFVDSAGGTIDVFLNGAAFPQFRNHGKDRVPAKVGRVEIGEYSPTDLWSIFSDFRIAPWSGVLPGDAGDRPWLMLTNGDSAPATLTGVRDGKLLMDSDAGPLELSMQQVSHIDCGGLPKPAQPKARVHLRDGSILQMDGCHLDGKELTGHSARLGEFKIPRESIAELILHPSPPRFSCAAEAKASEHGQPAPARGAAGAETKP